jgi:flavin-dependent dehydrogenase
MAGYIAVVGGGWAGCSAALAAAKSGVQVMLMERTDMLLGTGLVGGIMRNNGRYTATEECIALGGGDIFKTIDACARHTNVEFPGHSHATLYYIAKTPTAIEKLLIGAGV